MTEEKTTYELMFAIYPKLGEEKTNKELNEVRSIITGNGGEIFNEDIWGERKLAYKVKREEEAFYAVFNFKTLPEKMKEINKTLHLNQLILRFIILKTPDNYEMKTLKEYQEIAEQEQKEKQQDKKPEYQKPEKPEKPIKSVVKTTKVKPVKVEKAEVEAEAEAEVEKPKPEKPKSEEPKANLEDIDAKLKKLIDDPDISL